MTRAKVKLPIRDDEHKSVKRKNEEGCDDQIVQFVNPTKRKKRKENKGNADIDAISTDSHKREKNLRFSIEGEVLPKGSDEVRKVNTQKTKIRKPRWSEERKIEERKRRKEEPCTTHVEEKQPKKKKKTKKTKTKAVIDDNTSDLSTSALQYLQHWRHDRSSWKFSKKKQTWLLKHTFDLKKIPSSMFPILVEYISSCKGGARLKTYGEAAKIIQKLEEKVSVEECETDEEQEIVKCLEGEETEKEKEEIHQRARSIMQQLSDCT